MSAATILAQAFGEGACLYHTVLNVPKEATPSQLRKAYYKKALIYHPDKLDPNTSSEEKESAKAKFQAVSVAYTILSDPGKRAEYDESGDLYEEDDDLCSSKSGVQQWTEYFRNVFPTVTTADIDAFEVKYKCSDEEEADVLKYYTQFKGDLNKMLECVMLSSDVDKERWVKDYIEPAVQRGEVKDFGAKMKATLGSAPVKKRKMKGGGRKKEIEVNVEEMSESEGESDGPTAEIVQEDSSEMEDNDNMERENNKRSSSTSKSKGKSSSTKVSPKKKGASNKAPAPSVKKSNSSKKKSSFSSEDDLIAQIRGNALARNRQAGFNSLMEGLEERYGGGKNKKNKGKTPDDISDEEFEKIQAKMLKKGKSQRK